MIKTRFRGEIFEIFEDSNIVLLIYSNLKLLDSLLICDGEIICIEIGAICDCILEICNYFNFRRKSTFDKL